MCRTRRGHIPLRSKSVLQPSVPDKIFKITSNIMDNEIKCQEILVPTRLIFIHCGSHTCMLSEQVYQSLSSIMEMAMGLECDLTQLDDLTEATIRDRLRERYERDLIYVSITCMLNTFSPDQHTTKTDLGFLDQVSQTYYSSNILLYLKALIRLSQKVIFVAFVLQ